MTQNVGIKIGFPVQKGGIRMKLIDADLLRNVCISLSRKYQKETTITQ